jgi:ankyrin repeat protein
MSTTDDLIAAVNTDDAERVTAIVTAEPALANTRAGNGVSVLMLSRYRHDRGTTDALLAVDPDLDVFEATAVGYLDRLRDVLTADPSQATAFSPDGFTALHFAGFYGKADAARLLLEAGAEVNVYSRNGFDVQALHSAAAGRHTEVCRVLVAAGADVNARQQAGYTPLHEAAQHGDTELVELFLSAGADATATKDDGETPADTAEAAGHHDLAERLRGVAAAS